MTGYLVAVFYVAHCRRSTFHENDESTGQCCSSVESPRDVPVLSSDLVGVYLWETCNPKRTLKVKTLKGAESMQLLITIVRVLTDDVVLLYIDSYMQYQLES